MRIRKIVFAAALAVLLVAAAACSQTGEPQKGQAAQNQPSSAPPPAAAQGAPPAPAPGGPVSGHTPSPAAGGQLPQGHPPMGMPPTPNIAPAPAGSGMGDKALVWTLPANWKEEPPRSALRRAQFRVPGADGDPEDGECAVFYFGPGAGGSPEDNAGRWVDQFSQPDGSSSQGHAKVAMRSIGGKEALFVEVKGTYNASVMGGMGAGPKRGYALLGAIVNGPDAPWFFKFTGPEKTVEKNRAAFESLIASLHPGT